MRFVSFITLFLIMVIFLEITGTPTPAGSILSTFNIGIDSTTGELTNANADSSSFWGWIYTILIGISVGGVVIGFFAKGYDPSIVVVPVILSVLILLSSTSWILIRHVSTTFINQTWMTGIVLIILGSLWVEFIGSALNYYRGYE